MAEESRPHVTGLAKAFAEFSLLPDLLQASRSGGDTEEDWTSVLRTHGFNDGHLDAGDLARLPPGGLAALMARDARRLCERLQLLTPGGPSEAGQQVAEAAGQPAGDRPSAAERAAAAVVGEQIRRHYLGADGLALAALAQQAAAALAAAEPGSRTGLPGLVLAEFDTLLYWGLVHAGRGRDLVGELPRVRVEVRHRLEQAGLLAGEDFGTDTFCDAVTTWHYEQETLAFRSPLSMTELRVTALAMTWSGLLAEVFADFGVSVLAPVPEAA